MSFPRLFCFTIFGMILLTQALFSQIIVQGTVTDNGAAYLGNGADPVAGALVTIVDQADTTRTFNTYTDAQGDYTIEIIQSAVDDPLRGPGKFRLLQNYPNPFNPSTVIGYELSRPSHVSLDIYNVLGQKVKTLLDGFQSTSGTVIWYGTDDQGMGVPAGVYIYSLEADGQRFNKKMLLVDGHHGSSTFAGSSEPRTNHSDYTAMRKQLSDQFTLTVSGEDIADYEQRDLTITSSTTVDVTVCRTMTDIDGNVYATVRIGDQWWMAEHLKVRHYRNGEEIPEVIDDSDWINLSTGARCAYHNDETYVDTCGYLYNWYAVSHSLNIAPEGWHVPTDAEWMALELYLGMAPDDVEVLGFDRGTNEGSKLAAHAELWIDGDLESDASFGTSGFRAHPGDYRNGYEGYFNQKGMFAIFWMSSEYNESSALCRILNCFASSVSRYNMIKRDGYSVRLIRD